MSSFLARAKMAKAPVVRDRAPYPRLRELAILFAHAVRHLLDLDWIAIATRYAVHASVLVLLLGGLVLSRAAHVSLPSWQPLMPVPEAPTGSGAARHALTPSTERHFLASSTVPFTARVLRETLPLGEPKQAIRTSILAYEVQPGDTVLGIAEKFGIKGSSLLWANDKLADNPDFLSVGQELNILPVDGALHAVRAGETVESIALRYQVSSAAITKYAGNHLSAPYALQVGQQLIIPEGIRPYTPRRVFAYSGDVPKSAKKGTGAFVWPMSGLITQRFWQGHMAIDIGGARGTPIVASDSGYVAVAQWSDVGYGRMIILDHGNGSQTLYAHLSAYFVEVGQSIGKGQLIGHCGSTGNATGPHVHFEIIKNGVRRNPLSYLP